MRGAVKSITLISVGKMFGFNKTTKENFSWAVLFIFWFCFFFFLTKGKINNSNFVAQLRVHESFTL